MTTHQQQHVHSGTAHAGASVPRPVDRASKLMVLGAVASLAITITAVATPGVIHAKTTNDGHTHSVAVYGPFAVIGGLIGLALWLWMARSVRRGRGRARILSTIFMFLGIIGVMRDITGDTPTWFKVLSVIPTLIGLAAVTLLWRRESSDFFERGASTPERA